MGITRIGKILEEEGKKVAEENPHFVSRFPITREFILGNIQGGLHRTKLKLQLADTLIDTFSEDDGGGVMDMITDALGKTIKRRNK